MNASNLTGGAFLGKNVAVGDQLYLFDVSASGVARTKSLTVAEARRGLGLQTCNAQGWASGALAIIPGTFVNHHVEELTVTLGAGTATLTMTDGDDTSRFAGNQAELVFILPGTSGLIIEVRNTANDLLCTVTDPGSAARRLAKLYHNGTKWKLRALLASL